MRCSPALIASVTTSFSEREHRVGHQLAVARAASRRRYFEHSKSIRRAGHAVREPRRSDRARGGRAGARLRLDPGDDRATCSQGKATRLRSAVRVTVRWALSVATASRVRSERTTRIRSSGCLRGTPIDPTAPDVRLRRDVLAEYHDRLKEEAPYAYKDITPVVQTVEDAHVARRVARLWPLLTIKG